MARTLVGRLQLIVQAMGLGEAKKVEGAMASIERTAKRLSSAPWGQNFQRQIEKMALGAKELDQVRRSWNNLQKDLSTRGLTAALKKSEVSAWKTATLGHFAAVRAGMRQTEAEARRFSRAIQTALRPAYVMLGGYTGVYMTGVLGREAIGASAERQREYFRQRMGDIPKGEQDQIFGRSQQLSQKYPSVNITDIMEMARTARNTMGSTERGMEVLDRMVQGFVTLQSAKGIEAATSELTGLMKGLDNLGTNSNGAEGVKNVNNLIDAFVRAAQIEGNEFDVGSMWSFARRSRIAGPGLSPEFLATVAPAMIQDMGADGAGTALAMAYKAFVIGANDTASKVNIAEQRRMGLRTGEGKGNLIDSDLFGTNPYVWVKKNLVPALQKDGIDITNDTAVSKAVAALSRNSSATGLLTRLITQQEQNDRLIALYQRAMGTDAADSAAQQDPFVGWKGFQESLRNLSAAVGETVMPVIVPALNSLANTINSFAAMVKSGDPRVIGGAGILGAGIAAYGTWKVAAGIYGLITAGVSLQTAATMLQAAAVAQGGGAAASGTAAKSGAGWLAALGLTGMTGLWATLVQGLGDTPGDTFNQQVANQRQVKQGLRRMLGLGSGNPTHAQEHERDTSLYSGMSVVSPQRQGGIASLGNEFEKMLSGMDKVNSTTVSPTVDPSSIDAATAKANTLLGVLHQIGAAASAAASAVDAQMRRAHSDFGVSP
ncbi:hypothetical protein [Mesorhizobium sp.]|uniref:hypothetical protein n=1 Tax=Mesorhizobium sp. TaxID=1871066 RepID=UPI001228F800|nr:hypothetical protein [Mesorhizobium sp.]TIS37494.1 MAG: hypothetical protein E5W95_17935 [Mesorhizobium sp.]